MSFILAILYYIKDAVVFLVLFIIGMTLTINSNYYQNAVFFDTYGNLASKYNKAKYDYNDRKFAYKERDSLLNEVAKLKSVMYNKSAQLDTAVHKTTISWPTMNNATLECIDAHVIFETIDRKNNVLIIDRGSKHGVEEHMGVVSNNGIVGVINEVNPNYSVVLPLINTKSKLFVKLKRLNYSSFIEWDGRDPRVVLMNELPRYTDVKLGDTLVTDSRSLTFPEGVQVGTVKEIIQEGNDNYKQLKIKTFTDITQLRTAYIVKNKLLKVVDTLLEQTHVDEDE